jgi:hypothetical protein
MWILGQRGSPMMKGWRQAKIREKIIKEIDTVGQSSQNTHPVRRASKVNSLLPPVIDYNHPNQNRVRRLIRSMNLKRAVGKIGKSSQAEDSSQTA